MDKKIHMFIVIAVTFVIAVCWKNDFIRFLLGFEILVMVVAYVELLYLKGKFSAMLILPETYVDRGQTIPVVIHMSSTSRIPVPKVRATAVIRDLWADKDLVTYGTIMLDSQEKGELRLGFDAAYCGAYAVTVTALTYWDHLGIFHRTVDTREHTRTLYVMPEVVAERSMDEALGNEDSEGADARFRQGRSTVDTTDVRNYRQGDLQHHIHWKLSAKLDQLMVREMGEPIEKMNRLYLNLKYYGDKVNRDMWDAFLVTVARTSTMMLHGERAHYVCWIDLTVRKMLQYKVNDAASLQEMLCGLFHAQPWKDGEAVDILEDIRWDETMEENIEINLQGEIIFAGDQR